MHIVELQLHTADVGVLERFYGDLLGLPITTSDPDTLAVQIGRSRLLFVRASEFDGRYHVAFDVPNNQLADARSWLESRTPLVQARDGTVLFHSDTWNADQFYFLDPAGNILELIARHTSDTAQSTPFTSASVLAVTEIGLATPDVVSTVGWLCSKLELEPYGDHSDTFTPVGDEQGLFIVVKNEREWFPDTGVKAVPLPFEVTISGRQPGVFEAPGLPYRVVVVGQEPT